MIATRLAVLIMTAMIIGVVGISVAASQAAEATAVNTTRSNIKALHVVQQEANCTSECTIEQNLTVEGQNAESGDDFSTNDWSNSAGDVTAID